MIITLLIISVIFCSCAGVHVKDVPYKDDIKAHWIKKGERAEFDGILLNEKAYKALRSKIIELRYQLDMCLQK